MGSILLSIHTDDTEIGIPCLTLSTGGIVRGKNQQVRLLGIFGLLALHDPLFYAPDRW